MMLVRADASAEIGSGHVMRCLALAKAWQALGGEVCYLMAESVPALDDRLALENIRQVKSIHDVATPVDEQFTVECARRLGAAWVVVDGYKFGPSYIREVKASGAKVLTIDDDARFDFYEADVVLNQNLDARPESYRRESSTHLLLGARYVLLRPEFLEKSLQRDASPVARNLLVTMGGSDSEGVTSKVMRSLPAIGGEVAATVVVGGGSPHYESLQALAKTLGGNVILERNPASMAPVMRRADVAVSAAGGTCWELAFLGIPMILITISRDQEANAAALAREGAALSLGWHANLSEPQISDSVKNLIDDMELRRAMSERGRKLVDGKGPDRVVQFLQSVL
jgi:UDP-2,4-diacetamido-2,4,6-trideoxy-beta-L-altropyranose hydrolase